MPKNKRIIVSLLLIIGSIIFSLPIIRSGLITRYGLSFWGANAHDGLWHLSLINHLTNPFNIELPIFPGFKLINYHPFYNILIAFIAFVSKIPSNLLVFQIFPLVSSFIILYLAYKIATKITKNYLAGLFFVFLTIFATSFGWLISLLRDGQLYGESMFWAMQSFSTQINPPYTLSLIFLLLLINETLKKKSNIYLIALILLFSPITKAYSIVPIFIIAFFHFLNKKQIKYFFIFSFFSLLLFLKFNASSSSLIVYKPFWFLHTMVETTDRLYLPKIVSMIYALKDSPSFSPKLFVINSFLLFVFILGNYSWRIFAFFEIKNKKYLPYFLSIIICTLIPLFFVQKGTAWNTIQFLYYALFLSNLLLTIYIFKNIDKALFKILLSIIIITSIIGNIGNLKNYLSNPPPTAISLSEIEALNFLKQQEKGIVLTPLYDPYLKKRYDKTPIPLYAYETTAYVSAYSHQKVFLEDEMNLSIIRDDWQQRKSEIKDFFDQKNPYIDRNFLLQNNIRYIYLPQIYNLSFDDINMYLDTIFENEEIRIIRVKK